MKVLSREAVTFLTLVGLAVGNPLAVSKIDFSILKTKESIALPTFDGWTQNGSPDPKTILTVHVALKRNNVDGLLVKLLNKEELSNEEIQSHLTPAVGTADTVKSWLSANGINSTAIKQPTVDTLTIDLPISKIESLLNTKYSLFSHPLLPQPLPRTLSYSIPQGLHGLIDLVHPTTELYRPVNKLIGKPVSISTAENAVKRGPSSARRDLSKRKSVDCDPNALTPSCILTYYYSDYTPTNQNGGQVGTIGIGSYYASTDDFNLQMGYFQPGTPLFRDYPAGANKNTASTEGNLDTQLAAEIASPNPSFYAFPGGFYEYSVYASDPNSGCPASTSMSYAAPENIYSGAMLTRMCNNFGIAAAYGLSIFVPSGDNGVGGNDGSCPNGGAFRPIFPASCPYVTAVGSTGWNPFLAGQHFDASKTDPGEVASSFSGGGFSNYFAQPDYQKQYVQSYISSLNGQYDGLYNKTGRAYPDVAALGEQIRITMNGKFTTAGGTSASAPLWAAVSALVDDSQIANKHRKIGLWNMYVYPGGGNMRLGIKDITYGNNPGCGTNGFGTAKGWDPVTGMGTPQMNVLRLYAQSVRA